MKHIIIIDDSPLKCKEITCIMQKLFPSAEIVTFGAINSGLYNIHKIRSDIQDDPNNYLIITDVCLPLYDTYYVREPLCRDGAKKIIRELNRLMLSCPVIVQSSEPVNAKEYEGTYNNYLGVVHDTSVECSRFYKKLLAEYLN